MNKEAQKELAEMIKNLNITETEKRELTFILLISISEAWHKGYEAAINENQIPKNDA